MAYHLVPSDREQGYLMPPSLQEWLPEGDLAWFILDVVEQPLGADLRHASNHHSGVGVTH